LAILLLRGMAAWYLGSMSHNIEAIYEKGVFRPLHPVDLPENVRVQVSIPENAQREFPAEQLAQQQKGIQRMLDESAKLPAAGPNDGLTNRDHDKILYGKP
jgi:predicted DNA-binding antitoxin AbrB/MazE fold protein